MTHWRHVYSAARSEKNSANRAHLLHKLEDAILKRAVEQPDSEEIRDLCSALRYALDTENPRPQRISG